jgi:ABC-type multidrug transport system ATPase subunit
VIFSTHIIEDVASSCNMVAVMKKGEVQYLGAPIKMAKIAEDKVWLLNVNEEDFDQLKKEYAIIHHMKDGDNIRCRCLSDKAPTPDAKAVNANLEDAYLYLLTKEKMESNEIK